MVLVSVAIGGGTGAAVTWDSSSAAQALGIGAGFVCGLVIGLILWAVVRFAPPELYHSAVGRVLLVITGEREPRRRLFQFSLRELMIVVTICAIACSVFAVKKQQAKRQRDTVNTVIRLRGTVVYAWERQDDETAGDTLMPPPPREPPGPEWVRTLLGVDFVSTVVYVSLDDTEATDLDLQGIGELTTLQSLILRQTQVTDAGLLHLGRLKNLRYLNLEHTRVSREGVAKLQQALPNCKIDH